MYIGGFKQNLYPARSAFQAHPLFASTFGLVSLWRFEDGTNLGIDTYGTNNLTNNNGCTQGTGKVGSCLTLVAASNQYLNIADNASLQVGSGDFWMSAWFKPASLPSGAAIVSKATSTLGANLEYLLFTNSTPTIRLSTRNGGTSTIQVSTVTPVVGNWHFVFCWFNKSSGLKYISVNLETPVTNGNTTAPIATAKEFEIGAYNTGLTSPFDGSIDEVSWGKLSTGSLGNGSYGTLAYRISQMLYNNGNGLAWPW